MGMLGGECIFFLFFDAGGASGAVVVIPVDAPGLELDVPGGD